jgi:hypothetical protein
MNSRNQRQMGGGHVEAGTSNREQGHDIILAPWFPYFLFSSSIFSFVATFLLLFSMPNNIS